MIVVITGASAGVGRATAREFAAHGWDVALIARGAERLETAAREVEKRGTRALPIVADVADHAALDAAAERVEREFGPIDVWVNNAMATVFAPVSEIKPEEFRRATEVTYLGQVHGTMTALARMRRRNHGTIINVGSALSYRAIPLQSVYCGAKFAVRGFTDALRSELIHDRSKVRLMMVHLPAVNTPQFDWALNKTGRQTQPLPPIFQPEVPARAIYHAARHPSCREKLVGFSTVKAILGNKVAPGLLDRYLTKAGYDGQLTAEPRRTDAPANLFAPVASEQAAHGRFDARARDQSEKMRVSRHPAAAAAAVAGFALIGVALWRVIRHGEEQDR